MSPVLQIIVIVIQLLVFLGGLAGIYVAVITRITRVEVKTELNEKAHSQQYEEIKDSVKILFKKMDQILMELQNKQNRL